MVIDVLNVAGGANTSEQGAVLLRALTQSLAQPGVVVVSFNGISTTSSSFVNVAFVTLLRQFPFSEIKRRIQVVDSTRQINSLIKSRMEREALLESSVQPLQAAYC